MAYPPTAALLSLPGKTLPNQSKTIRRHERQACELLNGCGCQGSSTWGFLGFQRSAAVYLSPASQRYSRWSVALFICGNSEARDQCHVTVCPLAILVHGMLGKSMQTACYG